MTATLTNAPTSSDDPRDRWNASSKRSTIGHPTVLRTLAVLLARDIKVMRRNIRMIALRAIMQPLAFVFVFAYVEPKIGFVQSGRSGMTFSTVLVPGLVAVTIGIQGLMAVMTPLLTDFSYNKEIEDRAMAPVPVRVIGLQKIISGAIQGLACSAIVFPLLLFVHAKGQAPSIHVANWPEFLAVMACSGVLASSTGLLVGTVIHPGKAQQMLTVIVIPMTMLGCVYFPWSALHSIRWLQVLTCLNPVVYMSEGLRATLTPNVPHMPWWALVLSLVLGTCAVATLAVDRFNRRVVQ